jgi:hypothetical protein
MSGSDYRPVPIEDVMARFSPERQARIHERARELLLEEATLRELRVPSGRWLECEGGVISGLFNEP